MNTTIPSPPQDKHILWTISHIGPDGFRRFTLNNHGPQQKHSRREAEMQLARMLRVNGESRLKSVFGPHFISTARIDWVECYPYGERMAGGARSFGVEYHPDFDLKTKDPEQKRALADACLIAAAPDLLDALEDLLAHEGETQACGIGVEIDSEALEKAKRKADAAIAKARGES